MSRQGRAGAGSDGAGSVICQRCLRSVDYPLSIDSVLELIANEVDLSQDELEDDTGFPGRAKELDVVALVEDEIILALPPAPRHDDCALPDSNTRGTVSPFAARRP